MRLAALALALAGCNAATGTLELELTTAPGSTVLASIERIRLTLTNPPAVYEATRTADGIDLSIELEAVEDEGVLIIQGYDASDVLIANGQSPPFPLAGSDSRVVIYVAPPYSILAAPQLLLPARSFVGGAAVLYGAALAGGLDASGSPSASMDVYNAYDHSLIGGADMPAARGAPTLAANSTAGVYIFGGTDASSMGTSTLYRFQTNIAPEGVYADLGVHPGLESSAQRALQLGPDTFLVTGTSPALIETSTITPITSLGDVPSVATAVTMANGGTAAAFVREGSVWVYELDGTLGQIALPAVDENRAIAAGAEPGTVVVLGGATRDAHVVDLATQSVTPRANALSVVRERPTVAATSRHILVASGFDENGALNETADILDARTLERVTTIPVAARAHAVALPMPNDQLLIAGGEYVGRDPDGLIELFTPPSDPALPLP